MAANIPANPIQNVCPFIGLQTDASSLVSYPTQANVCYRCKPLAVPSREQQSNVCISVEYVNCPIYKNEDQTLALPDDLRWHHSPKQTVSGLRLQKRIQKLFPRRVKKQVWVVVASLLGALVLAYWLMGRISTDQGTTILPTPMMTRISAATAAVPTDIPTDSLATASADSSSAVIIPTSTEPSVVKALLKLDTPLGADRKFLIHRMASGENLQLLAKRYKTEQALILQITKNLTVPVWAGKMVVVPVNQTDVTGVPFFEPYEVTQAEISTSELSQLLGVDLAKLEFYNGCVGCVLQKGSWVLIPQE